MALRSWNLPATSSDPLKNRGTDSIDVKGQAGAVFSPPPDENGGRQTLASFVLRVQFRHNACWQGNVAWLEGKQSLSFRSFLELISLLGSATEATAGSMGGNAPRTPAMEWIHKTAVS